VVTTALRLSAPLAEELLAHARAEAPNEACGILAGSLAGGWATAYHPARNADASPYVYTIDSDDLYRILTTIDDAGEDVVGIFHSHTHTPAVPSPTDRRQAQYPDAFYLLASLTDPDAGPMAALRAWRITDGEATEVPLEISAA
jgi:proteasome lid subunit RPN8/RPN11